LGSFRREGVPAGADWVRSVARSVLAGANWVRSVARARPSGANWVRSVARLARRRNWVRSVTGAAPGRADWVRSVARSVSARGHRVRSVKHPLQGLPSGGLASSGFEPAPGLASFGSGDLIEIGFVRIGPIRPFGLVPEKANPMPRASDPSEKTNPNRSPTSPKRQANHKSPCISPTVEGRQGWPGAVPMGASPIQEDRSPGVRLTHYSRPAREFDPLGGRPGISLARRTMPETGHQGP
jgi:hypothetical protein